MSRKTGAGSERRKDKKMKIRVRGSLNQKMEVERWFKRLHSLSADSCDRKNSVSRWRKPKGSSKASNGQLSSNKSLNTPNNNLRARFVANRDRIRARTP